MGARMASRSHTNDRGRGERFLSPGDGEPLCRQTVLARLVAEVVEFDSAEVHEWVRHFATSLKAIAVARGVAANEIDDVCDEFWVRFFDQALWSELKQAPDPTAHLVRRFCCLIEARAMSSRSAPLSVDLASCRREHHPTQPGSLER